MQSLDELRRVIRRIETGRPPRLAVPPADQVLGGELVETGAGPLLVVQAAGVVTFNGSGFDLPLLETRFVLARRRWPALLLHLDLLRPARRVFTARCADCRLTTLEREVIGLEREDDVAGALIPALYFDFLRSRRAAPLARVFGPNRHDVLSLVALLGWFGRALATPDHLGAEDLAGLGRLWEP